MLPNTTQLFNLILGPKTSNSLLVVVKNSSTQNPIEGATVTLTDSGSGINTTKTTGGSSWNQEYWNGGSGQADWQNITEYYSDSGGIDTSTTPLALRLASNGGDTLVASAYLDSSSFDTGSKNTNYTTINWEPASQNAGATVQFQIATNNDDATWNFVGPDGTSNTYFTSPGASINSLNDNNRYIRYRAYLSTTDNTKNPTITNVGINYVAGCSTPGQVIFSGLNPLSTYTVTASMAGYTTKTISSISINGSQVLEISLTPNS